MSQSLGWYGKLACRGDFVGQGLPPAWQRTWDEALRRVLAAASHGDAPLRERLQALPAWQGLVWPAEPWQPPWLLLVLPSADRVGRAWPLVLAEACPAGRLGQAALRARAQQWLAGAGSALQAASPEQFGQWVQRQGQAPWPVATPAEEGAAPWSGPRTLPRSWWWPAAGTDTPVADGWPPALPWLLRALAV